MGRPRLFYIVYGQNGARSRIAHGLDELYQLTGQRYGDGFPTRERAEEEAAWRDYRHGPDQPTYTKE